MTWPCENTVNQAARHFADRLHMSSYRRNNVGCAQSPNPWSHTCPQNVGMRRPCSPALGSMAGEGGRETLPPNTAHSQPSRFPQTAAHLLEMRHSSPLSLPHMISSCIHFKEQTFLWKEEEKVPTCRKFTPRGGTKRGSFSTC